MCAYCDDATKRANADLLSDAGFSYGIIKATALQSAANSKATSEFGRRTTFLFRLSSHKNDYCTIIIRLTNFVILFTDSMWPLTWIWRELSLKTSLVTLHMSMTYVICSSKLNVFKFHFHSDFNLFVCWLFQTPLFWWDEKIWQTFEAKRFELRFDYALCENDYESRSHWVSMHDIGIWLRFNFICLGIILGIHRLKEISHSSRSIQLTRLVVKKLETI